MGYKMKLVKVKKIKLDKDSNLKNLEELKEELIYWDNESYIYIIDTKKIVDIEEENFELWGLNYVKINNELIELFLYTSANKVYIDFVSYKNTINNFLNKGYII